MSLNSCELVTATTKSPVLSENDQDSKLGHDTEVAQLSCAPVPGWILAPKVMRF